MCLVPRNLGAGLKGLWVVFGDDPWGGGVRVMIVIVEVYLKQYGLKYFSLPSSDCCSILNRILIEYSKQCVWWSLLIEYCFIFYVNPGSGIYDTVYLIQYHLTFYFDQQHFFLPFSHIPVHVFKNVVMCLLRPCRTLV